MRDPEYQFVSTDAGQLTTLLEQVYNQITGTGGLVFETTTDGDATIGGSGRLCPLPLPTVLTAAGDVTIEIDGVTVQAVLIDTKISADNSVELFAVFANRLEIIVVP